MLIHSPRSRISPPSLDIQLGGCRIELVTCFKFLGILVSDTLCWSNHVTHITRKVSQRVNLLRRLSLFLPSSLLVLYLKSYILPCVDYCDVVWHCCSKQDANRQHWLKTESTRHKKQWKHRERWYTHRLTARYGWWSICGQATKTRIPVAYVLSPQKHINKWWHLRTLTHHISLWIRRPKSLVQLPSAL